jgi:hypothetical protein
MCRAIFVELEDLKIGYDLIKSIPTDKNLEKNIITLKNLFGKGENKDHFGAVLDFKNIIKVLFP